MGSQPASSQTTAMPPKGSKKQKGAKAKKAKKVKDPNAPKRPMSAYFLFMNEERAKVRKENPDGGIGDIAKILGKMWAEVDSSTKARLDKEAAAAKKKWEVEKAAYAKKKAAAPATSFVARVTRKPGRSQLLIFSRSYFHTIVSYTSRNEYSAGSMTSTVYPSYVRASLTILSTC